MHIKKSISFCALSIGMQIYGAESTRITKQSIKFEEDAAYLKSSMSCEHAVLKARPAFYSKIKDNKNKGELPDFVSKAYLFLEIGTPVEATEDNSYISMVYDPIQKVDLSLYGDKAMPYLHIYFDDAGGVNSPAHYRLMAVMPYKVMPDDDQEEGTIAFYNEVVPVEALFEVVDVNTCNCVGKKGARIEVGNKQESSMKKRC